MPQVDPAAFGFLFYKRNPKTNPIEISPMDNIKTLPTGNPLRDVAILLAKRACCVVRLALGFQSIPCARSAVAISPQGVPASGRGGGLSFATERAD